MTTTKRSSTPEMETQMLEVRKAFERTFQAVILSVVVLVIATGLAILFVAFNGDSQLSEKILVARFIQVSFGMTIGSGCVFLGVILILLIFFLPEGVMGYIVSKFGSQPEKST